MVRVITEARRYSEQVVIVLAPYTDDRLRLLAELHGVSYGKAARVALRVGLSTALEMDRLTFLAEHTLEDDVAARGHADCTGPWCKGKAGHALKASVEG